MVETAKGCRVKLPPISSRGKVLLVGSVFSRANYGSHVVMRELLKRFDPESFRIVVPAYCAKLDGYEFESQLLRVGGRTQTLRLLQFPWMAFQVVRWVRRRDFVAVVTVYPWLDTLPVGLIVSWILRLPFIPYLHDTISEATETWRIYRLVLWLQRLVFARAARIFVMSDGMAAYYRAKYGLNCVTIRHPYTEPIQETDGCSVKRNLFWAGGVYEINDKALLRVISVATRMGVKTVLTTASTAVRERILAWRDSGLLVEPVFYEERSDYLEALRHQGAHVLALNAPTDSSFGHGELATIFPTKTPEYLASGRPILVFCPKDYALAGYFTSKRCGVVVTDADDQAIEDGIRRVLSDDDDIRELQRNAVAQARMFSAERVAEDFARAVDEVIARGPKRMAS